MSQLCHLRFLKHDLCLMSRISKQTNKTKHTQATKFSHEWKIPLTKVAAHVEGRVKTKATKKS